MAELLGEMVRSQKNNGAEFVRILPVFEALPKSGDFGNGIFRFCSCYAFAATGRNALATPL
jgi:hypothetical protein